LTKKMVLIIVWLWWSCVMAWVRITCLMGCWFLRSRRWKGVTLKGNNASICW
jgi:hypothetical protein